MLLSAIDQPTTRLEQLDLVSIAQLAMQFRTRHIRPIQLFPEQFAQRFFNGAVELVPFIDARTIRYPRGAPYFAFPSLTFLDFSDILYWFRSTIDL